MNKLFMVSLGAGDPDLITIKALKRLKQSKAICVPTKSKDNFNKSLTKKIIDQIFIEHNFTRTIIPVFTPMKYKKQDWQYQVDVILDTISKYKMVSFVTLGDASVYSTVYFLLDLIKVQDKKLYNSCEVIEGITSFSNASAMIKKPLCVGNSRFEIVPLLSCEVPATKVYMRPKVGLDTSKIKQNGSFYSFENLNFADQKITKGKIDVIHNYMTLLIDFYKE